MKHVWGPRCHSIGTVMLATVVLGLSQGAWAAPLDRFWPLARHDARRTNYSPAASDITAPVARWRYFMGGGPVQPTALDVDHDASEDVVAIEGGRVVARTTFGKVLWATPPLGIVRLAGIADLTGDGQPEIVAVSSIAAHLLSAQTGALLWTSPKGLFGKLAITSVADFDGDGARDLALADAAGAGLLASPATHIFRFVGAATEVAVTALPSKSDIPSSGSQNSLDVDGDGLCDILQPGFERVFAFSGKTGALLAQTEVLPHVVYTAASSASRPAKDGGAPWLVYVGDYATGDAAHSLRGLYVLRRSGSALVVQWSLFEADLAGGSVQVPPGAIGDLDGDGLDEILLGRLSQGNWSIEARDLETGTLLTTLAAQTPWLGTNSTRTPRLASLFRVGQTGPAALHVILQDGNKADRFAPIRLLAWTRKAGFSLLADLGQGELSNASVLPARDADAANLEPLRPALPLGPGPAGVAELMILRDADGDRQPDLAELVRVDGAAANINVAQLVMSGDGHAVLTLAAANGERRALLAMADGHALVLGSTLGLRNDADGDAKADLTYGGPTNPQITVAPVHDNDAVPRVLLGAGGVATVLDLAEAGPDAPPTLAWSARPGGPVSANLADLDGDGAREVLLRHTPVGGSATLKALSAAGLPLWSYAQPEGPFSWSYEQTFTLVDADGDGGQDAVSMWSPQGIWVPGKPYVNVISGKTGQPLWPLHAPCTLLSESLLSIDDTTKPSHLVSSAYHDRFTCDAATGAVIKQVTAKEASYGTMMLADLNGDGLLDGVLGEAALGVGAEQAPDSATLWFTPDQTVYHQPAALVPVDGTWQVATLTEGSSAVTVRDAKTGKTSWQRFYVDGKGFDPAQAPAEPHTAAGLVAVADLSGTGHPSLVLSTSQGMLYAVDARNGHVDWVLDWGGTFGDPIPADLDGDGKLEILVGFSDGYLYAIDQAALPKSAWIRENGGAPALSDADDLDTQEDATAVHANWAPVPGATGYAIRLVDDSGAELAPARPVGAATQASISDLHLQPGVLYRTSVAAEIASGPAAGWSAPTLSDGIAVVDVSPPTISAWTAQPAALLPGTSTTLSAHLADKTRLASWTLAVDAPSGKRVGQASAQLAQAEADLAWTWTATDASGTALMAGDYTATLVVLDTAGHLATAATILHLCGPGSQPQGAVCQAAKSTPVPALVHGTHPDACCQAGAGGSTPRLANICALLLLCWAATRARRRGGRSVAGSVD